MICCKIYLMLSALITCHVSANNEHIKSLSPKSTSRPWNKQYEGYDGVSSEILPDYSFYELSKDRSIDHSTERSSKPFPIIKKEPIEEKNLKKIPFYAVTNKDSTRYKELTPDLGIAHCQEIKVISTGKKDEPRKGITTCYSCKDPKTKSTYERCLYSSYPEESVSANTEVESYTSAPAGFRYRRSNSERGKIYGRRQNPYRFTEEYFTGATHEVPDAYKNKGEKCDKIVKNSMVCMVCRDAKTNGKYEQCSYVKQPHEKAYSYIKSSTFGKPSENVSDERPEAKLTSDSSDFQTSNQQKDRRSNTRIKPREYSYPSEDYPEKTSTANKQEVKDPSSADCRQVQRDGKTCTVCKDSKTSGTYEKCTYDYNPSDKLYKYSKSKTFGYPDKISESTRHLNKSENSESSEKPKTFDYPESSDSAHDYLDTSEPSTYSRTSDKIAKSSNADDTSHNLPDYSSDYSTSGGSSDYQYPYYNSSPGTYDGQKTSSSKPDSEGYSENISADNCRTLHNDSMTCTICKDPKTGNDFEQCSYSYQPRDKLFSYSKSSSFGNPQNEKSEPTSHEDEYPSDDSQITKKSYDEYVPGPTYEASTADEVTSKDNTEGQKRVDAEYLDAVKKKVEIEEFMQKFGKEDRSKCKKIMRDKMTCYQCVDDDGFQKEECAFATGHGVPDKDQIAFHETKEFQIDSAPQKRDFKSSKSMEKKAVDSLEPSASSSRNFYVKLEKPDNDYTDETSHTTATEETKEAEPYDYTSETRSKYDKVLRLTLPAYMFATSEHEAAFDEIVASDQR